MKIVALYKTFSGNEFIEDSLNSIYNYVEKIVCVNSNISWSNSVGNTVHSKVMDWKNKYDIENKIINLIQYYLKQIKLKIYIMIHFIF